MTTCTFCSRKIDHNPHGDENRWFCSTGCQRAADELGLVEEDETHSNVTAETEGGETVYFSVSGMYTRACESFLERRAKAVEGVEDAAASYTAETIRVTYKPATVEPDEIRKTLSSWGYRASEPTPKESLAERNDFDFDHLRSIFGVVAVSPVYLLYATFFYPVYLGIYPASYLDNHVVVTGLYGPIAAFSAITVFGVGFPILRSAYVSLSERYLTIDVLTALTALVTFAYSMVSLIFLGRHFLFFDVATTIIVVATIGNHARARFRRNAIQELTGFLDDADLAVRRLTSGGETEEIDIEDCVAGDRLLVRAGERIPFDGTITEGTGAVNEALVTGEARPQRKAPGDDVIGGATVADGAFEIDVGEETRSTLDRLRDLVWNLQTEQTAAERLTARLANYYVPAVLALSVLTLLGWLALGTRFVPALLVALSVLIVACPVSLGLVTPLAIGRGLRDAADRGISILDQTVLERAPDVRTVAFDKTGTLTTGEMRVESVVSTGNEKTAIRRAASVESRASHPIATAIRERAPGDTGEVSGFERHRYGVSATVDGVRVAVGSYGLFEDLQWPIESALEAAIDEAESNGAVPTVVGWAGEAHAVISFTDTPRPEWETVVKTLADEGRQVVVITGDDSPAASRFESHPAVRRVFAGVPPEAKERIVRRLQQEGSVAIVGDGTNDAPALAAADLGVAMVSGSDFTATVSDALITSNDIAALLELLPVARGTRRRLRENLALAFAVPLVGLPLAIAGLVTPIVAAALMFIAMALVLANSYRSLSDTRSKQ